ncbi:hypothetical protein D3C83_329040 [compost metagenome]
MAPIPRLPEELAGCQPLLDGMMAKRAADRFDGAAAVLEAIDAIWTTQALRAVA